MADILTPTTQPFRLRIVLPIAVVSEFSEWFERRLKFGAKGERFASPESIPSPPLGRQKESSLKQSTYQVHFLFFFCIKNSFGVHTSITLHDCSSEG
ncbi:hypothetical protein MKY59_28550 [Paenibacillus sp. FSL W8-0426]|uniref:hypothetical protein n=1 Tax=Paenibacillus sp. FSL W8-0426 TaxID=2921714 RepID=UPI0030D6EC6B